MVDEAPTSIDNKKKWKRGKIAERKVQREEIMKRRRQCNLLICLDEDRGEDRGGIYIEERNIWEETRLSIYQI